VRPKIVKLIDKYSQKRADLVSMNESFVRARTIFDRMMEESLARHTGAFDPRSAYGPQASQGFGWSPPLYDQSGYSTYLPAGPAYPPSPEAPYPPQFSHSDAAAYPYAQPYPGQPSGAYPRTGSFPPTQSHAAPAQQPMPAQHAAQVGRKASAREPQALHDTSVAQQAQSAGAQQPYSQSTAVQYQAVQELSQVPPYAVAQARGQMPPTRQSSTGQQMAGPPYVYDPNGVYPDPNAQAWAQYYAQGGTDPTGAAYFISVPGLTDKAQHIHPQLAQEQPQQAQQAQQTQQTQQTQQIQQTQPSSVHAAANSSTSSLQSAASGVGPLQQAGSNEALSYMSPLVQPQLQSDVNPTLPVDRSGQAANGYAALGRSASTARVPWTHHQQDSQTSLPTPPYGGSQLDVSQDGPAVGSSTLQQSEIPGSYQGPPQGGGGVASPDYQQYNALPLRFAGVTLKDEPQSSSSGPQPTPQLL
jgi:signal transducing adaptor molecule